MNRVKYISLTLPDIIEHNLGIPFRESDLSKANLSARQLGDLAAAIENFYSHFPTIQQPPNQLRPYISPTYVEGMIGHKFVSSKGSFQTGFVFDETAQGEIITKVKQCLLYSHAVCTHDYLPYLLDYFAIDPEHEMAKKRIPAVKALLIEYSKMEELLRSGILMPLSSEVFGNRVSDNAFVAQHTNELRSRLPAISVDRLALVESIIRKEQMHVELLNNDISLYFPEEIYVTVLAEILRLEEKKFTSAEIKEPFRVGTLVTLPWIDSDAISARDIIAMRMNDELFERWRTILTNILERLHNPANTFTDLEREVAAIAQQEARVWEEEMKRRAKEKSILGIFRDQSARALVGGIAGIAAGKDHHTAAVTAAATILGGVITDKIKEAKRLKQDQIVRRHFLAFKIARERSS